MLGGALCVVDGHDLPVCAHVPYRPRPTGRGATVVVGVGKRSKERGGEVDFGSRRLTLKDNFGHLVRRLDVDKINYMSCLDYRAHGNSYANEVKFFCYENIIITKKYLLAWTRTAYSSVLRSEGLQYVEDMVYVVTDGSWLSICTRALFALT